MTKECIQTDISFCVCVHSTYFVKKTGIHMWKRTYACISIPISCYQLYMQKLALVYMEVGELIEA